jgi:uncharacterized membrane protein
VRYLHRPQQYQARPFVFGGRPGTGERRRVFDQNRDVARVGSKGRLWWRESERRRVLGSGACGLLVGLALAWATPWQLAVLASWDLVAVLVLSRVWFRVGRFSSGQTKEFATLEDDSRASAELLLVAASVASLAGAAVGLLKAHQSGPTLEALLTVASVLTVALSWAVVHTVFALRYAHEYYTAKASGAIDFKSGKYEPDYGDFAYVAFTVGMTFQVSDTDIGSRLIRRTVLRHALISYLFGAIIVALMVNVLATLLNT